MSNALHRITKEYRLSVNTPDFLPTQWIINPDVSAVVDQPTKYWKITGDSVSLMTQAERDAVDVANNQTVVDNDRAGNKARFDEERVLRALALTILDEINVLRVAASLTERTPQQLVNAVKSKIDQV